MKADDKGRRSILPGWNEFGAPAKSDALILHSVSVKARGLLKAAKNGDAALMTEMKRTLMKKNLGQSVPESLEGKVTHDSILDKFKECYEKLYNSAVTEDAIDTIKTKLKKVISENKINAAREVQKVTGLVVKQACA